jgi:hypothetical protein
MQQTQTDKATAHQGLTTRKDTWWLEPTLVAIGFGIFGIYATFRAIENGNFETGAFHQYLSPFYSPHISWHLWNKEWGLSSAWLILWIPGAFRATCYYYRKAYYRAYFWDPPACSVGHMGGEKYCGETSFPFVLQNLHRYFFYLATVVLVILWIDVFKAMIYNGGFHLSGLSLFMLLNVLLLSGYSFGCHACRHLAGGRLDCFSCPSAKPQHKLWQMVTRLNEHHMGWAWFSLFSVGLTDLFIRAVSLNQISDFPIF